MLSFLAAVRTRAAAALNVALVAVGRVAAGQVVVAVKFVVIAAVGLDRLGVVAARRGLRRAAGPHFVQAGRAGSAIFLHVRSKAASVWVMRQTRPLL